MSGDDPISPHESLADWVVCFSSFFILFICDGFAMTYGILLLELMESFEDSKTELSSVGSIFLGFGMLIGPLVSWLLEKFTCRQVLLAGGFLTCLAFAVSSLSTSPVMLMVIFGVGAGSSFGLLYITGITIVGVRFHRHRTLATGIALSGAGAGIMAMGYPIERLTQEYGWRGTLLIVAGIFLNCCVFAALIFPKKKSSKSIRDSKERSTEAPLCHNVDMYNQQGEHLNENRDEIEIEDPVNSPNATGLTMAPKNTSSTENDLSHNVQTYICNSRRDPHEIADEKLILSPEAIHSRNNLAQSKSNCDISPENQPSFFRRCIILSKNFSFILCLLTMCFWTGFFTVLVYLPDLAVTNGLSRTEASLLISMYGVTNILGRPISGAIITYTRLDSLHIYITALLISAVDIALMPYCVSFLHFSIASIIFGLCCAALLSMRTIVLVEVLGVNLLVMSFGILCFCQGICYIVGPPLIGVVLESSGSFYPPFYLLGGFQALGGLLCLALKTLPCRGRSTVKQDSDL